MQEAVDPRQDPQVTQGVGDLEEAQVILVTQVQQLPLVLQTVYRLHQEVHMLLQFHPEVH